MTSNRVGVVLSSLKYVHIIQIYFYRATVRSIPYKIELFGKLSQESKI